MTISLPEDFKEYVRAQGVDNDKIAKILEASPRNLFDVFDNYGFYAEILYSEGGFHYTILNENICIMQMLDHFPLEKNADDSCCKLLWLSY